MSGSRVLGRDSKVSLPSLRPKRSCDRGMGGCKSENYGLLREFYIPDYILEPELAAEGVLHMPDCPVLVFINSRSGGQLGGDLLTSYRILLNKLQVHDLREEAPDKVLHKLYRNLERLKSNGDDFAAEIVNRLKLIVAGGDGTASWLLGVVSDLKLARPPPIATVPLGTGNNLPFSFGWGKKNPGTDCQSVKSFLDQVKKAKEMKIDSWHIIMRMKAPKEGSCDPIAPLELPHSLHAFQRVSSTDSLNMEGYHTFRGGFWNYFSMGMDAQVSYAFHSERKLHPEKFKSQIVNQSTYAKLGCTQGWFCPSLVHPSSRNIAQLANVKIMKRHGSWESLNIPRGIRSIICLNLPSFSGGLNPWGTPNQKKAQERDLTPPFVDDGLLEVVGFRDAWHGLVLLAPKGHGTRIAQGLPIDATFAVMSFHGGSMIESRIIEPWFPDISITEPKAHQIRFEFQKAAADQTYMRIDGEPWKQPLPVDDDTVVVEISHHGQVKMLATKDCRSKSINDPSSHSSTNHIDDDDDEDHNEDSEERRKFGAADTFRIPDGVDVMARLS